MSGSSKNKAPDHLGFLDGIRGGAALWVLLAHCMIWGGWYGIPLPSPKIAVDIFMVASGFLMVYQYRRRERTEPLDSKRTACRFWVRRFFRIAPVYYLLLLFLFFFWNVYADGLTTLQAATPQQWSKPSVYNPAIYQMTGLNVFLHATFLFGVLPGYVTSNLSPDWSIALEMQFYALFPVLFFIFRRISWIGLLIAGVGLSMCCNRLFALLPGIVPGVQGLFPEPSFLPMKLPLFLIGMLAGETFCSLAQAPRQSALMTIAAILLAGHYSFWTGLATGAVFFLAWNRFVWSGQKMDHPFVVGFWLNRILSNRCTAFMADASYSVYLTHLVLISLFGGFLFRMPGFLTLRSPVRVGILAAIVCSTAYLLAAILHHMVEKPGIELGKRLMNKWVPVTSASRRTEFIVLGGPLVEPDSAATSNAASVDGFKDKIVL